MSNFSKSFTDLIVWQKAHGLVLETYKYSKSFPKEEVFGLTSQLRRSVVSVAANIAEGFKKKGKADKARFMNIAQGSLEETRYYFILSNDLEYCNATEILMKLEEVSKLLEAYSTAIIRSIKK